VRQQLPAYRTYWFTGTDAGTTPEPLILGASLLRLAVTPAICIAVLLLLPLEMESRRVLVLIATMPVAMASVTLAEAYKSDADFSASAILLTHLLCLVTVPFWLSLILR